MNSIRQLILDHTHTTADVHITTKAGEQHRVIGFNRTHVLVPGDRDGHYEKIPFDDIKYANAYGVEKK